MIQAASDCGRAAPRRRARPAQAGNLASFASDDAAARPGIIVAPWGSALSRRPAGPAAAGAPWLSGCHRTAASFASWHECVGE
eukprot:493684-Hanusia_phi.AAC.2